MVFLLDVRIAERLFSSCYALICVVLFVVFVSLLDVAFGMSGFWNRYIRTEPLAIEYIPLFSDGQDDVV